MPCYCSWEVFYGCKSGISMGTNCCFLSFLGHLRLPQWRPLLWKLERWYEERKRNIPFRSFADTVNRRIWWRQGKMSTWYPIRVLCWSCRPTCTRWWLHRRRSTLHKWPISNFMLILFHSARTALGLTTRTPLLFVNTRVTLLWNLGTGPLHDYQESIMPRRHISEHVRGTESFPSFIFFWPGPYGQSSSRDLPASCADET